MGLRVMLAGSSSRLLGQMNLAFELRLWFVQGLIGVPLVRGLGVWGYQWITAAFIGVVRTV